MHGLRHPDVFGALADHSGDSAFEYCYLPDFPAVVRAVAKHGSLDKWYAAFLRAPQEVARVAQGDEHHRHGRRVLAEPARSRSRVDLPFDLATGEIDAGVWKRWLAWDPVRMVQRDVARYRRAAKSLRLALRRLRAARRVQPRPRARACWRRSSSGPARGVVHEEFDDGHMDIPYRYDRSLEAAVESPVSALGKLWTLPNTVLGLAAGGVALALGARAGVGRNAIEFHDSRLVEWVQRGAITLGNTIHYARGMHPDRVVARYDGRGRVTLGEHERAHTLQYERWGPLFLVVYALLWLPGVGGAGNPFEHAADDRAAATAPDTA